MGCCRKRKNKAKIEFTQKQKNSSLLKKKGTIAGVCKECLTKTVSKVCPICGIPITNQKN